MKRSSHASWLLLAKNIIDRVAAALLLVLVAPVIVGILLAVRLSSPGPALFKQTRVGRDGRLFTLHKFRTMRNEAEGELTSLRDLNQADGPLFKIRDDPRSTRVGSWLRRWSLDELPQLWNVVQGDMSLVGPRPPLPSEVARYQGVAHRRLLVKPGLTGMWQVNGRADLPWSRALAYDLYYVEHWSLVLDLVLLAKTPAAVLGGRGAY